MTAFSPLIVGIGGTSRPDSTTERAVRHALAEAEALGARTRLIDGALLSRLPLYAPDRAERTGDEAALIAAVRDCHGLIVGTPGYHGSLSGTIKNALDLLEDSARDQPAYLDGRAMGTIVTAYGWMACGTTMVTLRSIAHALRAWPTPFGAALNTTTRLFDEAGACLDDKVAHQLGIVARQVVDFARWRHAGLAAADAPAGDATVSA